MSSADNAIATSIEPITRTIRVIRGQRVILDRELAQLYGVTTKRFNEQVRRNIDRFPEDFMFRLTSPEAEASRLGAETSNRRGYNIKYLPYAFTEHGAIQAANVLNSPHAIAMGVYVVRAFIQLRGLLASNKALASQLAALERALTVLDAKTQRQFKEVYDAIRALTNPPPGPRRGIGFTADIG